MNSRNWIYDRADFGGRGAEFGVGLGILDTQQDLNSDPTYLARKMAEEAEAQYDEQMRIRKEAEAAEAQYNLSQMQSQMVRLQQQLEEAQSQGTQTAANIASSLQSQITTLTNQLLDQQARTKIAVAEASAAGGFKLDQKYLILGAGAALVLLMLVMASGRRTA